MMTAIWLIVGAVATWITWRIRTDPRRRREKLLKQIRRLEDDYQRALFRKDGDTIARLNRDLRRLREEIGYLAGK